MTRTKELKDRLEKASAVARAHKKDELAQALVLMIELVVELHERIDGLEGRLEEIERKITHGQLWIDTSTG